MFLPAKDNGGGGGGGGSGGFSPAWEALRAAVAATTDPAALLSQLRALHSFFQASVSERRQVGKDAVLSAIMDAKTRIGPEWTSVRVCVCCCC